MSEFERHHPIEQEPSQEIEASKETREFITKHVSPRLKKMRTLAMAGLLTLSAGYGIKHQEETSELKTIDPVERVFVPIFETIEDMDDVFYKAGAYENMGDLQHTTSDGSLTLRSLAEDIVAANFEKALETNLGQEWAFGMARRWARLNNLTDKSIDEPIPASTEIFYNNPFSK